MKKVFYIDPQSGDNLAMYDYELLSRIEGIDIHYICSKTYKYNKLENTVIVPLFNYTRKTNSLFKGISYIFSLISLLKYIIREKPQVIHIQWFRLPKFEYYYYKILKKIYKFSFVHTVHNILPHVKTRNASVQYAKLYSLCDMLITHTESSSKDLVSRFRIEDSKITVAPHGPLKYSISSDEISNRIREIKDTHKIKAKNIVALLGYQSFYKGTDLAINAWLHSKKLLNNPDWILIVAGKSKDYSPPELNSNQNIIIINDKLSDLDFISILKMSSLVLLPYRRIDQSGVLLTIIEEQIPYCATEVGELCKPFEVGDIGWRIPYPSEESVRITLEYIMKNSGELDEKKERDIIWNTVKELYSWDRSSKITKEIYDTI